MSEVQPNVFNVKIDGKWFKKVIHWQGSSIRKLGADKNISRTERTIRRAVKKGSIGRDLLDEIAKKIDVYPEYLAGRFEWTRRIAIMEEDGVREYWDENFLNPSQFPYQLEKQFKVTAHQLLIDALLLYGVPEEEFGALDLSDRRQLRREFDRSCLTLFKRWFPKHADWALDRDLFQSLEWKTEGDVMDALFDYLVERGLVEGESPDWDDYDPFSEKYKIEE